ncbi:MAG TPA: H(+)/Cl(-) exchange transporter ClcA [Candidatus Angelobacter sp.]|nr:H(+)/Cl(-) exchange transporter ClcA [Candidatus Angelobacter sp.]
MDYETEHAAQSAERYGSLLLLALSALAAGAAAGLVGTVFRISLVWADRLRNTLVKWSHDGSVPGFLLVSVTCATATGLAAWLVRRFSPHASGSGIPHVEAVLKEELLPVAFRLIWVKFLGGLLSIGSGLALGREGPSVQMGASLGHLVGKVFRRGWPDCRVLLAAGAGAGLATAFNAPIAGAVFVLEELVRRFETRIAIAALGASATAISVAWLFLGNAPEFRVEGLPYPSSEARALFFILGAVTGVVAVVYNNALLRTLTVADRLCRWPVELRAALVGGGVGMLAWFAPGLVGGGDLLTQNTLSGAVTLGVLPLVFLLRFGLGPVSYSARTPGGLFAPMLVLGAQLGLLFGDLCRLTFPGLDLPPEAFAVVGMAAFFTGVVRAPITGIVLIIEMTASFTMLLPMLGACFVAMLVPTVLGNAPIYNLLRERAQPQEQRGAGAYHENDAA